MDKYIRHNRKSIRLKEYDYSRGGYYFVTICTSKLMNLFGEIVEGEIKLNEAGTIVEKCIKDMQVHFPSVSIDYYCIMPNHLHLIIILNEALSVGVQNFEPLQNQFQTIIPYSLGSVVKGLKIGVTKWFRQKSPNQKVWQRNYYEHVIRNDKDLYEIRKYIQNNPLEWEDDEYFTATHPQIPPVPKKSES
ncbi:MAG: hypothetical protein A2X64_05615 [Ignavibacteria bacterium GWF2_33_9]|nr:MAG: hypothetical protein A2X64_05615 [Ignavibacteria bacterium GWF2_33_9]